MYHENPAVDRLLRLAHLLLLVAAVLLFYKVLFRPLLPLAVAFLLSCLLSVPSQKLHTKTRLPLVLCTLAVLLALAGILVLGGWLFGRLAISQLGQIAAYLPEMLSGLEESLSALQLRFQKWFPGGPDLPAPSDWLEAVPLPELGLEGLAGSLGWAASSLPDLLLTAVFVLAATLMLVCFRPQVLAFLKRQLPPQIPQVLRRASDDLKDALMGWAKAQGILMAVTFLLLLVGFFLLRVRGSGLLAFGVALMDALPVLGAGLALIPWALVDVLMGNYGRAAGLAGLYALILAVRNGLEPQVVGKQIGLHPLVSLIAFYLGWRLAGLMGMILGPILALILVKLREWGYSKLWR